MNDKQVSPQETIHCNRCNKAFYAPKEMTRDGFCGQKAARVHDFCTCPHCEQTDGHWVFASDLMPEFEGGFEKRRKAERQWLRNN